MKICCKCKAAKPTEEFGKQSKNPDGLNYCCKPCKRAYDNQYNSSEYRKSYIKKNTQTRSLGVKKKVLEFLLNNPCCVCGEKDPIVLDFDHLSSKRRDICVMTRWNTWEIVLQEIQKCQVLCANCHRRKTAKDKGYFRYMEGLKL